MILKQTFDGYGKKHFWLYCPACNTLHSVTEKWGFNNNFDKPSFSSSLGVNKQPDGRYECHVNVTNGRLVYHGDSNHNMGGQTIDMIELTEKWLKLLND